MHSCLHKDSKDHEETTLKKKEQAKNENNNFEK